MSNDDRRVSDEPEADGQGGKPTLSDAQALEDRRLRWRCRRGMLELDLLLLPYVEQKFWHAPAAERSLFLDLLEEDDPVLFEWFNGRNLPVDDAPRMHLIARIRGWS